MRLLGLSRGWPRPLNRGENYNAEMEFRDFDNRLLNAGSTVTLSLRKYPMVPFRFPRPYTEAL